MDRIDFSSFGLSPATMAAIERKGFEEPTSIQALAIPRLLEPGPDLIARARTGTGKTAAFGIPLVERLSSPGTGLRALVLVPTRELALQVTGEILSLRGSEHPRVAPVYGGASMGEQLRRLAAGVDIVVGTPGRILDHISRGSLDLSHLEFLVLDEADEMLDMGFIEDIETIMGSCAPGRRVVLFSATMPGGIVAVARKHLASYETIEDFSEAVATELAEQVWLEVREGDRLEALCRVMDVEEDFYGIVFTATRVEAERVAKALEERGYEAEALHGEITQDRRERILSRFRDRRAKVLVATDVAARGIDIERLSHVVNWSLPHDPESYLHRVGRTGRAGNAGTALTFVTPEEYRKLFRFRRASGGGLKKARVPAVDEVLAARLDRIRGRILARAESESKDEGPTWDKLAEELLGRVEARSALAAALFEAFGDEVDPKRYREIEEVSVDAAATTRLFIGLGKRDRATARDLSALVRRLTGLPDRLVGGIEVYENFSFATVPFEAAEKAIAAARGGSLPPIRLATPRGSGRSAAPGGDRGRAGTPVAGKAGSSAKAHGAAPDQRAPHQARVPRQARGEGTPARRRKTGR
jgi:ATP-dependent RNA helicase DeaD